MGNPPGHLLWWTPEEELEGDDTQLDLGWSHEVSSIEETTEEILEGAGLGNDPPPPPTALGFFTGPFRCNRPPYDQCDCPTCQDPQVLDMKRRAWLTPLERWIEDHPQQPSQELPIVHR